MGEPGGFDYLDSVSKDTGGNKKRLGNLQVDQMGMEEAPVEGGEGYVGGNPNASTVGFDYVTGKKGYSEDKSVWSDQTGNEMDDAAPEVTPAGTDSTDEKAPYKRVQTDEGLPQTYRDSSGAGDAGPTGSDEPKHSSTDLNTQSVPSSDYEGDTEMNDMPQTEFTGKSGDGAPLFKHKG